MLRVFHHYFSGRKLALFTAETAGISLACLLGAVLMASALAQGTAAAFGTTAWTTMAGLAVAFVVAMQFALYVLDLYDLKVANEDRSRGNRLLKAGGAAMGAVALVALVLPADLVPAGALLGGAMGALAGSLAVRTGIKAVVGAPSRVLIVGNGEKARAVAKAMDDGGEDCFSLAAMFDPTSHATRSIETVANELRADYVVTACDDARGGVPADALLRCRLAGIKVYDASAFCERILRRMPVAHLRASYLAFSDELAVGLGRSFAKRAFDITVSAALLLLASPVLLIVAALIKLDSKGPLFYRQERVGLGGKSYFLWKFRSMRTDAEKDGAVWAKANDDRVTRIGKFIRKTRIDEIPQVLNVLLGDMSFVGPRPERPIFVEQLKKQIPFYELREAVKPGITGWAQIRYPYGASVEDARNKLEFDLYYVKNGSLFLDLAIIFHTVRHVLLARGAR